MSDRRPAEESADLSPPVPPSGSEGATDVAAEAASGPAQASPSAAEAAPTTTRGIPRALGLALGLAAAGVAVLVMRQLAWLMAPVVLALVLVILFSPVHTWMRRRRVPEVISLVAFVLVVFGVL
ncbi:MAG TPA: hypothetical protein VFP34_15305, partial [Microlunatus sp.]|nr:hypothetical protein [Microlunatus sp.]